MYAHVQVISPGGLLKAIKEEVEPTEVPKMSSTLSSSEARDTQDDDSGDIYVDDPILAPQEPLVGRVGSPALSPVEQHASPPLEPTTSSVSTASAQMRRLGLEGDMEVLSDVIIKTADGGEFPLHKACLANESRFFRELFQSQTSPIKQDSVVVPVQETAAAVSAVVAHVYGHGADTMLSLANIGDLVRFYDKYDMPEFKGRCDVFLCNKVNLALTVKNVPQWLVLASDYKVPGLLARCENFVIKHYKELQKHESLLKLDPTSLVRILHGVYVRPRLHF